MFRKLMAEAFGTFWLVFAIVGTAKFTAGFPTVGVGILGVSLAAGLAVTAMAYAVGPVSGGHFNPAVTLGLHLAGRFPVGEILPYWAAQVIGGALATAAVFVIGSGAADFAAGGFASNGYADLSPGSYSLLAVFLVEVVVTALFLVVILGSTAKKAAPGFAPIAIGITLTIAHFIAIPVSNASLNPARSIAAAIFASTGAWSQIWVFVAAPLIGGALGALAWRYLLAGEADA